MYQNHSKFFREGEIMNAIELLKEDHNKVSRLFQKVKGSEESEHKELFEKIKEELEVHTHIEETIFYPKMKEEKELEDIVLEGIEEHHQTKIFLRELSALTDESEKFEPKLKVLMEGVEHHVQEEEGEMFPKIEELFDQSVLEELGKEMEKEKQNFKKSQTATAGK
jgi:iron-sulfur cluster repair protein YtfE (RIC family)